MENTELKRDTRALVVRLSEASDAAVNSLRDSIIEIGPALLTRYVEHQADVCQQSKDYLNRSLKIYLAALETGQTEQPDAFNIGDLWSGLIWWKDEASWVGKTGIFSLSAVTEIAIRVLKDYLAGTATGDASCPKDASVIAIDLFNELTKNGAAPGLRAIISYAAKDLGL
jgi:hypothetical protein